MEPLMIPTPFDPQWATYNNPVDIAFHGSRVFVWSVFAGGEMVDAEFKGSSVRYQLPASAIDFDREAK
jgi:hypothetical protein